jgi:hypothetical protein
MTKKELQRIEDNVPRFKPLYELTKVPKWAKKTKEQFGLKVGDVGDWCPQFGFSKQGDKYTYKISLNCIRFKKYIKTNTKKNKAKQVFKRI